MLQCISNAPIDSFSTSRWLKEFQRWTLKNRRRNHKWAFDWKSSFYSCLSMRQSKHNLKDSPAFPIPGVSMHQIKNLNMNSFHQSLKKASSRSFQAEETSWKCSFLLHWNVLTRFDSNYTAYQLACQNSWHISANQIPCYEGRVNMRNVQLDI